jgi:hypothetical protein
MLGMPRGRGARFIGARLKSLKDYPPRQGADTLNLHKALEAAMAKMEAARTNNN